jgi:hypothetical protein
MRLPDPNGLGAHEVRMKRPWGVGGKLLRILSRRPLRLSLLVALASVACGRRADLAPSEVITHIDTNLALCRLAGRARHELDAPADAPVDDRVCAHQSFAKALGRGDRVPYAVGCVPVRAVEHERRFRSPRTSCAGLQ